MKRSHSAIESADDPKQETTGVPLRLEPGERRVIEELWLCHREVMIARARRVIAGLRIDRTQYDADDAVADAFFRICSSASRQKLATIEDRDGILKLLFAILRLEILDARKRLASFRRGGGGVSRTAHGDEPHETVNSDSAPSRHGYHRRDVELEQLSSAQSSVEVELIEDDCFEVLLKRLDDGRLRAIATMRREGYNLDEIARRLRLAPRTLRRRLTIIRSVFQSLKLG